MSLLDLEGQRHDLMAPLSVDLWKVLEKLEAGEKLKTNMQCGYYGGYLWKHMFFANFFLIETIDLFFGG